MSFEKMNSNINANETNRKKTINYTERRSFPKIEIIQIKPKSLDDLQQSRIGCENFLKENFKVCEICMEEHFEMLMKEHTEKCIKSFMEVPCKYCKQEIVPRYQDEHYAECFQKLIYDYEKIQREKQGFYVSAIIQMTNYIDCPICIQAITQSQPSVHLMCAHQFHTACIQQWLRKSKSCPVCNIEQIS